MGARVRRPARSCASRSYPVVHDADPHPGRASRARAISGHRTPCVTLRLTRVVAPVGDEPVGLRLEGVEGRLLESKEETLSRSRETEVAARAAAEARVRELEAELRKRDG